MIRSLIFLIALLGLLPTSVVAQLKPDEVAILAADSRESQALANYYAKQRGIAAERICTVKLPKGDEISRSQWHDTVRPAIARWLSQRPDRQRIRCITTLWGVPLRIGKCDESEYADRAGSVQAALDRRLRRLRDIVRQTESKISTDNAKGVSNETSDQLITRLEGVLSQIQRSTAANATGAADANDTSIQRRKLAIELRAIAGEVSGLPPILNGLAKAIKDADLSKTSPDVTQKMRTEFDFLRGRATALSDSRQLLELGQLPSEDRDRISLLLVERLSGLRGAMKWLQELQSAMTRNESEASFDSELSLVLWPRYELLRWQNNFLHKNYQNYELDQDLRTLMVSRIDAPTLKLAKGLIDAAIATEKRGLAGKVYLDARGLTARDTPSQPGSSEAYDRSLTLAATELDKRPGLDVVLNDKAELFQPGECPNAALYCGWHSPAKYVDAFDWQPGSVAYHMSGAEAVTLKRADSQAWCKRMLEKGVCATIGPVAEPYEQAFPLPHEFFGMLSEGDLSLVECFYRTKPFNSWMLTLVGDPLYRPFPKQASP